MGHHHLPALPPVNIPVLSKTEPLRWRPRVDFRDRAGKPTNEADAAREGDEVYAVEAAREDGARKRRGKQANPAMNQPRQAAIAAMSDDTLRCLLVGQEGILDELT